MPPIGFAFTLLTWAAFVLAALGLFFWVARWFPRQRWLAPTLLLLFVVVALLARQSKWIVPLLAMLLLFGSAFIPRRR
jgi:hypothetical protein